MELLMELLKGLRVAAAVAGPRRAAAAWWTPGPGRGSGLQSGGTVPAPWRGCWRTTGGATRPQARDAPDTLSQWSSHIRLPLGAPSPSK